jgi:hypothetical protein
MTKLGYPIARSLHLDISWLNTIPSSCQRLMYASIRWYQEQYHRETAQAMLTAIQDEEEQQDV